MPTAIAVVVSWISFLMNPESVPGRAGCLITLLLILVNLSISIIQQSPAANSHNALMTWTYMCIGMVSIKSKTICEHPKDIPKPIWTPL